MSKKKSTNVEIKIDKNNSLYKSPLLKILIDNKKLIILTDNKTEQSTIEQNIKDQFTNEENKCSDLKKAYTEILFDKFAKSEAILKIEYNVKDKSIAGCFLSKTNEARVNFADPPLDVISLINHEVTHAVEFNAHNVQSIESFTKFLGKEKTRTDQEVKNLIYDTCKIIDTSKVLRNSYIGNSYTKDTLFYQLDKDSRFQEFSDPEDTEKTIKLDTYQKKFENWYDWGKKSGFIDKNSNQAYNNSIPPEFLTFHCEKIEDCLQESKDSKEFNKSYTEVIKKASTIESLELLETTTGDYISEFSSSIEKDSEYKNNKDYQELKGCLDEIPKVIKARKEELRKNIEIHEEKDLKIEEKNSLKHKLKLEDKDKKIKLEHETINLNKEEEKNRLKS